MTFCLPGSLDNLWAFSWRHRSANSINRVSTFCWCSRSSRFGVGQNRPKRNRNWPPKRRTHWRIQSCFELVSAERLRVRSLGPNPYQPIPASEDFRFPSFQSRIELRRNFSGMCRIGKWIRNFQRPSWISQIVCCCSMLTELTGCLRKETKLVWKSLSCFCFFWLEDSVCFPNWITLLTMKLLLLSLLLTTSSSDDWFGGQVSSACSLTRTVQWCFRKSVRISATLKLPTTLLCSLHFHSQFCWHWPLNFLYWNLFERELESFWSTDDATAAVVSRHYRSKSSLLTSFFFRRILSTLLMWWLV